MSVTITGLDTVLNGITLTDEMLKSALTESALVVETSAIKKVPVDTGQLKGSITSEILYDRARVGTNVEYAPYVEYGTGLWAEEGNGRQTPWRYQTADGEWHTTIGQQPQPWLRPALEENRDLILDIFRSKIVGGK